MRTLAGCLDGLSGRHARCGARLSAQHLPQIKLIVPEGTYLLWLDCREMGLSDKQLKDFFVREAGVGLSPGAMFGTEGSGHMRMNIGAPRSVVLQALEQIASAVQRLP